MSEHVKSLNDKVPELDAKIVSYYKELAVVKAQLAKTPPARQTALKQKALQILKRKKMYEQQRDQVQTRAFNMDQAAFAFDSVKEAQDSVKVMKQFATQMKSAQKEIDLNELEDINDDMVDMLDEVNEMNELMSRDYGQFADVDEADLDAELAGLDDSVLDAELGDASATSSANANAMDEIATSDGRNEAARLPSLPSGSIYPSVPSGLPAAQSAPLPQQVPLRL
jgi:charged multivesicular body protein 5